MPDAYTQLLDATIRHLEELQGRGVRFVPASREALTELAKTRPAGQPNASVVARSVVSPGPAATRATMKPPPSRPASVSAAASPVVPAEIGLALDLPGEVAAPSPQPALNSAAKATAFAELRTRVLACAKCANLATARKTVVFGVGSIDAELMFVGEAPGADEDEQGEPFVGRAGELLTKIIQTMGFQREDVYIANILKCRPDTPGQASGNRKPTPDEMKTCIPYLHEQIDLIRPRVLVALGGTAMEGLLNKSGITRLRGQWHSYRGIPLMPTYHPAYLLRNQAMTEKRKVWEDMLAVLTKLGRPISEKQQRFFLPR